MLTNQKRAEVAEADSTTSATFCDLVLGSYFEFRDFSATLTKTSPEGSTRAKTPKHSNQGAKIRVTPPDKTYGVPPPFHLPKTSPPSGAEIPISGKYSKSSHFYFLKSRNRIRYYRDYRYYSLPRLSHTGALGRIRLQQ